MAIKLIDGTDSKQSYAVLAETEEFIFAVQPMVKLLQKSTAMTVGLLSLRLRVVRQPSLTPVLNFGHYFAQAFPKAAPKVAKVGEHHVAFSGLCGAKGPQSEWVGAVLKTQPLNGLAKFLAEDFNVTVTPEQEAEVLQWLTAKLEVEVEPEVKVSGESGKVVQMFTTPPKGLH